MSKKTLWTIALAWSLLLWACSEQPKKVGQETDDVPSELYNDLSYNQKEYKEWKIGEVNYPSKYDDWDRFDENGHLISRNKEEKCEGIIEDSINTEIGNSLKEDSLAIDSINIDSTDIEEIVGGVRNSHKKNMWTVQEETRNAVYITIDDGPWAYTQEIAEELYKRGHRATFFLVGNNIKENRYGALQRAEELWHELWNHSFSHANFSKLSLEQAKEQLEKTERSIKSAGVKPAPYFRYPYWKFFSNKELFDAYMKWMGYEEVFWTIDTRDWSKSTTKKDLIKCLENVKPWDVILIHERAYTKDKTIPTIDSVLKSKWLISVPYYKK